MRRSVSSNDITLFSKLDMVYNQIRVLEAKQNETKFKCLGSGECCKIGLKIHMAECANIAFRIRQDYYLKLESQGQASADAWMESVVDSLKEAMHDPDWQEDGETTRHCAFYKNGCTIYGYRPMICRTVGTITTVDTFCPRIRNAYGEIDHYAGDAVVKLVQQFQTLLAEYSSDKDSTYNMVVYMPLGVLSFILSDDELNELAQTTEDKFWNGVMGWYNYRVHFTKVHGFTYEVLEENAKKDGVAIAFPKSE